MSFKAYIAIIVCKLLRFISRILHRGGTAMPGRFALKICPQLLEILAKDVKTVAITGTNGKTTSARMVEQAFQIEGKSYFANRSGANLISGITTEFVMNSSLSGKCRKEYAVIECDEAAARRVFPQMKPQAVVVTNLFQDQVDRYGDVTKTLELIRSALATVPDSVMCLNADCALTASLADSLPNQVCWFGIEQGASLPRPMPKSSVATRCIHCQNELEYDYVSYGHLGGFRCPNCGYKRRRADFAVKDILEESLDASSFLLEAQGRRELVRVALPAMYNVYNAVGAIAAACQMGLSLESGIKAVAEFHCGFGRMEQFQLGEARAKMTLVKNAAGCDQVIEFLCRMQEDMVLVICLNDKPADGTDISWIWDTDFEALTQLGGHLKKVIVSGSRAADLAQRLEKAGIGPQTIQTQQDYGKLAEQLGSETLPIFIMPNYTSMLELRQVLVDRFGGEDFWK